MSVRRTALRAAFFADFVFAMKRFRVAERVGSNLCQNIEMVWYNGAATVRQHFAP
jgi:hypothetical protein